MSLSSEYVSVKCQGKSSVRELGVYTTFFVESRKTPTNPGTLSAIRTIGSLRACSSASRAAGSTGVGDTAGEAVDFRVDENIVVGVWVGAGTGDDVGVWALVEGSSGNTGPVSQSGVSGSPTQKSTPWSRCGAFPPNTTATQPAGLTRRPGASMVIR